MKDNEIMEWKNRKRGKMGRERLKGRREVKLEEGMERKENREMERL